MRVTNASTSHYRLPRDVWWPLPIEASQYTTSDFEIVTCEIETDIGTTGFGFTYTIGRGGSAIRAALADEIIPVIIGRECSQVDALWTELHELLQFVGTGVTSAAIAAADIAIWDARARAAGLPLFRLLGAHRNSIPVYATGVNLAYNIDQLVEEVSAFRASGFGAVKIQIGGSLHDDLERLGAVRAALGDDCTLMVDAMMAWDLAEAARRARRLEPFDLAWLEQPLAPSDVHGYAKLQAATAIPLAAGESFFAPSVFGEYLRRDAIRVVQPNVIRLGISGWLRAARLADVFHLRVAPHFIPEIHAHLACAVPNASWLEHQPLFQRLQLAPVEIHDGLARPSAVPGHGMAFDPDVIDRYCVA
jgi:L-alanine-DL-glutamate epimerase-like enolase superfamily enzyme